MANDLDYLAKLHANAFERLRVLEDKVSFVQENAEQYAERVAEWVQEIIVAMRQYHPDDKNFQHLVDTMEGSIPEMEHTHVYIWGSKAGLPSGIGLCACGDVIDYRKGDIDNLYRSLGSTANRRRNA